MRVATSLLILAHLPPNTSVDLVDSVSILAIIPRKIERTVGVISVSNGYIKGNEIVDLN